MKLIKFKSLAIATLIATTSVSLVGCGGAKKQVAHTLLVFY